MPALPPGAAGIELRTTATLRTDGSIAGSTTTTATGPFAIELRRDAAWIQATGRAAAASQFRALGTEGSGNFAFDPPEKLAGSYTISGNFTLDAQPELLEGDSFAPPAGLRLLAHAGDVLLGPLAQRALKDSDATPCYPGPEIEEVSLTLPPGRHLMRMPKDPGGGVRRRQLPLDLDVAGRHADAPGGTDLDDRRRAVRRRAAPSGGGRALETIRHVQRTRIALSDE